MTLPLRLITLHFSQMGLTEGCLLYTSVRIICLVLVVLMVLGVIGTGLMGLM